MLPFANHCAKSIIIQRLGQTCSHHSGLQTETWHIASSPEHSKVSNKNLKTHEEINTHDIIFKPCFRNWPGLGNPRPGNDSQVLDIQDLEMIGILVQDLEMIPKALMSKTRKSHVETTVLWPIQTFDRKNWPEFDFFGVHHVCVSSKSAAAFRQSQRSIVSILSVHRFQDICNVLVGEHSVPSRQSWLGPPTTHWSSRSLLLLSGPVIIFMSMTKTQQRWQKNSNRAHSKNNHEKTAMISGIMEKNKTHFKPMVSCPDCKSAQLGQRSELQGLIPGAGKPKRGQQLPKKHETEHHPGKQRHRLHGTSLWTILQLLPADCQCKEQDFTKVVAFQFLRHRLIVGHTWRYGESNRRAPSKVARSRITAWCWPLPAWKQLIMTQ